MERWLKVDLSSLYQIFSLCKMWVEGLQRRERAGNQGDLPEGGYLSSIVILDLDEPADP